MAVPPPSIPRLGAKRELPGLTLLATGAPMFEPFTQVSLTIKLLRLRVLDVAHISVAFRAQVLHVTTEDDMLIQQMQFAAIGTSAEGSQVPAPVRLPSQCLYDPHTLLPTRSFGKSCKLQLSSRTCLRSRCEARAV